MDRDNAAPLREMWYFALPARAVRRGRMVAKTLLGERIVLARGTDGVVFALRDLCPHRAMPLRYGSFDGREIACCYHGWRFDGEGRCTAIPSLVEDHAIDSTRIRVKSYPVIERQGNLWIFFGDRPADAPDVPVLPDIDERGPDLFESMPLSADIDHAVVGLMDPAHGPFVHRAWWWRGAESAHAKEKAFAASLWGFTMRRHAPSRNSNAYRLLGGKPETEIVFRLPGVRIEHIRVGRHALVNLTAVTPLADGICEINHAIYWTMSWLTPAKPLLRPFVRAFLRQDRDIMVKQREGLRESGDPPLMLLGDADAQARWYYLSKQEYRRATAEGRAFVNPVEDRVLCWRS